MSYDPATMSAADADAIMTRVRRYCVRHGSPYGETPLPGGDIEEARQVIMMDTLSADWNELEWTYLQRNGRTLFPATLSEMGIALRAALFMAGRARRRGWVESGPMRRSARAESRRRDMDDSSGVGMASRAADPARMLAAVESAVAGIRSVTTRGRRDRSRIVKTRNSTRGLVTITRRPVATLGDDGRVWYGEGEYTGVQFERVTTYNFRRAGSIPLRIEDNAHYTPVYGIGRVVRSRLNPAMSKSLNRLPEGVSAAELLEALQG